jgi:hypothetical protein
MQQLSKRKFQKFRAYSIQGVPWVTFNSLLQRNLKVKFLFPLWLRMLRKEFLSGSLALLGYFLDKPLPYFLVKKSVSIMWKQYGEVEVFSLENGMFIFRFQDESTCEDVLEAKLWHVANKPLILRKWLPGMQVLKLTLSSILVWIKLMHLPLEFWTPNCLSHVASGVGKLLYADKVTEERRRLGYARC